MGRAVRSGGGVCPGRKTLAGTPGLRPQDASRNLTESQPDAACRTTNVPGGRVTQLESLGHLLGRGHQTDLTKPADRPPAVACSPQEKGCSPSQAIAPLRSPLSTPPSHLPGGASRGRPRGSQWSSSQVRPCPLLDAWPPAQRARVVCPARKPSMTRTWGVPSAPPEAQRPGVSRDTLTPTPALSPQTCLSPTPSPQPVPAPCGTRHGHAIPKDPRKGRASRPLPGQPGRLGLRGAESALADPWRCSARSHRGLTRRPWNSLLLDQRSLQQRPCCSAVAPRTSLPASSQPTPAHWWAQQARQTPWTRAQRAETVYPKQQSRSAGRPNGAALTPTTGGRVRPQDPWCLLLQALLSRWRFKVCALSHTLRALRAGLVLGSSVNICGV